MTDPVDPHASEDYTQGEQRQLTERLVELTGRVAEGGFAERRLDLSLLCDLHAELFDGIRAHAGKHRRPGQGSERLTFGPHRSVDRRVVEAELEKVFQRVRAVERTLDATSEQFDRDVLTLAVWAHAELVRIHPFEDGNGRTSRLVASHLLVRHGLRPVPIDAVKQEYLAVLNHYFTAREIEPLVALHARLYPVGR